MNAITKILVAVILSTISIAAAQADQTMKPLQGLSFHAGTKHAVGYFLTDKSTCQLVLTLADDANYAPTRFETAIEAGKSTRYQLAEGKSLEFACQGPTLNVKSLETSAAND